jgi:hypothetical protein
MKKILLLATIIACLDTGFLHAQEVVKPSVAHGAFGILNVRLGWMRKFCKHFNKSVEERQLEYLPMQRFTWEQPVMGLTKLEKIIAAADFVEEKMKAIRDDCVTNFIDVSHSYGGHVVAISSQMLGVLFERARNELSREPTTRTKGLFVYFYNELSEQYEELKKLLAYYSLSFDIFCNDLWDKYKNDFKNIVSNNNQEAFIKAAYVLGSPLWYDGEVGPFNMFEYDLDVVGNVYNCYSTGDFLQGAVGDQLLPPEATDTGRAFNLRFEVENIGRFRLLNKFLSFFADLLNQPTHAQMYTKQVARNILSIPGLIEAEREKDSDLLQNCAGGLVRFSEDIKTLPVFTPQFVRDSFARKVRDNLQQKVTRHCFINGEEVAID